MLALPLLAGRSEPLNVLCLGAHSDDIEIGCGGAILTLLEADPRTKVTWVVLSADEVRATEARASAADFLAGAAHAEVVVKTFRESHFPFAGEQVKAYFEQLKTFKPDLVFTHYRQDRHQDHRFVSDLTWNTFRNHLILEYEIPKYDGDLGSPNVFVELTEGVLERKLELLTQHFVTQQQKPWYDRDTFRALLRLRGIEAAAASRFAEGFYARKLRCTF